MPDPAPAWDLLRSADLVCSADEVQAAIRRIAQEVTARLENTYPVVLTVMGGGVFFAGQILPMLRFPLDFDYIHATRYGAATVGTNVDWRVAPPEGPWAPAWRWRLGRTSGLRVGIRGRVIFMVGSPVR